MNLNSCSTPEELRIVARYSSDEIELTGTADALVHFARCLLRADSVTEIPLAIPDGMSAAPFDGFLSKARVEIRSGKVLLKHDETILGISGSIEDLKQFSTNIESFAKNIPRKAVGTLRDHIHIEYYPDHFYLAPGSDPLILVKEYGNGDGVQ